MQTAKFAKIRLAQFEAVRVYWYVVDGNRVTRRVGAYSKGK